MSDQRPKREAMTIKEATVFNMWERTEAKKLARGWKFLNRRVQSKSFVVGGIPATD
jgi:hypothetical protein